MIWEKTGKTVHANGESEITYSTRDSDITIESRKKVVPRANGTGFWSYSRYYVMKNGTELKECVRLTAAKLEAENLIRMEKANVK